MAVNMISRFSISWGSLLAGVIFLGGCSAQAPSGGTTNPKIPAFDEMAYMEADKMAGGLLYDKWWGEGSPPGNSNPMITATGSTTDRDGESWRCEHCHAWDYNGTSNRGFVVGSLPRTLLKDKTPKQVYNSILNGSVTIDGKKKSHKFFPYINAVGALDLTKFLLDPELPVDTTSGGSSELGKANYTGFAYESFGARGCEGSTCHKIQANKASLLKTAAENPTEFVHKVRYGNATTIMPGGPSLDDAINILAYVRTLSASPAPNPITPAFDNARYSDTAKQLTDLIQGGLLYDKWWDATVPAGTAPTTKHPLWPATASTRISASTTWRCKQCHGWDYRGADGAYKDGTNFSGISGIISTNSAPVKFTTASDVFTYIKTGTNHAFGLKLVDGDIYALTRFVMTQRDLHAANKATFHFIDDTSLATKGTSLSKGGTLFGNNCETCHGADGKKIDFADKAPGVGEDEFVDTIAKDNPWELMHKVLYGHPGSSPVMPPLFTSVSNPAATVTDAADILAYAQTSLVPDVKRGGRLYDKWWDENGAPAPTTDQALWATRSKNTAGAYENTRSGTDSWRCKECHGWDYKGANGAYGTGSHRTGFKGVLNPTHTKASVETAIRSGPNHVFVGANLLSERDFKDLVEFVMDSTNGVTDVASVLAGGNTTTGQTLYEGVTPGDCKGCHGAQGTTVPSVDLAFLAGDNPQEFVHKARFGSPNSTMVPTVGSFTGLGLTEAGNVMAYAKTLTAAPSFATAKLDRGGRLFDKWWAEMARDDTTITEPTAANPMWATRDTAVPNIPADKPLSATWRCKTCHEWNYRGVGFTRTSGIVTSKDDLLSLRIRYSSKTETELQTYIFDWIKSGKNSRHNFGVVQAGIAKPLTDADLWDLTKFLLDGVVDTSAYLSNLGGIVTIDPAESILNGNSIYNGTKNPKVNCSSCHGADGVTSPPGTTAVLDILDVAKNEATEFFHKVRFGQPGTDMPAMLGVAGIPDLITANKEARDILGYTQDVYCKRIPKPTGC